MLKIAFFASGSGTNIAAVLDRIGSGDLRVQVQFILSNNSKAGALEKAEKAGIRTYHVSTKTEGSEENVASRMKELLDEHGVELLVLAPMMLALLVLLALLALLALLVLILGRRRTQPS